MAANDATSTLTPGNKRIAGFLLISFTVSAIYVLIAFWPDSIPETDKGCALYENNWFHMRLDTGACRKLAVITDTRVKTGKTDTAAKATGKDTTRLTAADSARKADSLLKAKARQDSIAASEVETAPPSEKGYIHLNTILLVMVAVAGFLGNMIHVATSFTTFVGSETFRKSWVLWYIVKPFTASALAIALYLAFGATNSPSHVDLDRTLTIAMLAGLFTDVATQKLKEVFEVIFSPKDNRPDKLVDPEFAIDEKKTEPATLTPGAENTIVIHGKKLTTKKLVMKIGSTAVTNASTKDDAISFTYKIPDADKDKETLTLLVSDEAGKEVYKNEFPVKGHSTEAPEADRGQDTDTDEQPVG
jgi:hypothetical protein